MNVPSSVCENVDNGVSRGDVCGARASDLPRVCSRACVGDARECARGPPTRLSIFNESPIINTIKNVCPPRS